jgi:hypothetical protein
MDMRKYTSGFIMPDDVRDGPRVERIISVYLSDKHQVPVLELESGDQFLAWPSVGRVLARAYGFDSDEWRGHTIELSLGSYTDKNGDAKDTVVLKPLSSRNSKADNGPQRADPAKLPAPVNKHASKAALDDEIPFVLALTIISAVTWLGTGGGALIA